MRIFDNTKSHGMVQYHKGKALKQNNTKFVTKTTPIASAQALGILKKIPIEGFQLLQEKQKRKQRLNMFSTEDRQPTKEIVAPHSKKVCSTC